MKKFYDTSSLLVDSSDLSDVVISSKSLEELEHIKTSATKSEDIKFFARQAVRNIRAFSPEVVMVTSEDHLNVSERDLEISNDNLIISTAYRYSISEDIVFYTQDFLCGLIAKSYFNLNVSSIDENPTDIYKGYKIVTPCDENLAQIYECSSNTENFFNCFVNEYVVVQDSDGNTQDVLRWTGDKYVSVNIKPFKSRAFGNIKPLDEIQRCAFDSIANNDITVLFGRAGSGKTTLPLAYISQCLETQKYRKCYIVYHYETLRNAKTLGYVKGDTLTKKLQTASLGGILSSKYGDIGEVERLIASGMFDIVSTADLRGIEFGADEIVFSTEAQDLDTYTVKTLIQRCKSGCKLILEGDVLEQCDTSRGIGLYKMIDVFKGYNSFGCVKLKNNYRSKMAELADKI